MANKITCANAYLAESLFIGSNIINFSAKSTAYESNPYNIYLNSFFLNLGNDYLKSGSLLIPGQVYYVGVPNI